MNQETQKDKIAVVKIYNLPEQSVQFSRQAKDVHDGICLRVSGAIKGKMSTNNADLQIPQLPALLCHTLQPADIAQGTAAQPRLL